MTAVILQPSYLPWRGYFHQIQKADVFVFYDDVQYDTGGWRHRNKIKMPNGSSWITIPILAKNVHTNNIPIHQIRVVRTQDWQGKHWRSIENSYRKAPFFDDYAPRLESFYTDRTVDLLADFTIDLTKAIAGWLGITQTRFVRSSDLAVVGTKTDRILAVLAAIGNVTHYISGPSAKTYIEEDKFATAGIGLEYMAYQYGEYPQLYGPFDPHVSVLDLLFMTGPKAGSYIWGSPEVER